MMKIDVIKWISHIFIQIYNLLITLYSFNENQKKRQKKMTNGKFFLINTHK